MTPRISAAIAALAFLLFPRAVPAPIIGFFPGLCGLIKYSDAIVVAQVVTGPPELRASTLNDWQPQVVRVLYVLKGELRAQSKMTVGLNPNNVLGGGEFVVGQRYLLVLKSDASSIYLMNVDESAFRVPEITDLGKLRSNDVQTTIAVLLNDLVSQTKGPNAAALKKAAAQYLQISSTAVIGFPALNAALLAHYRASSLPAYEYSLWDLNGDHVPDAVVVFIDNRHCVSRGCSMVILRGTKDSFAFVSSNTTACEPIYLLNESKNGWKSLAVSAPDAGVTTGEVVLRFNGERYAGSPSHANATSDELRSAVKLGFSRPW